LRAGSASLISSLSDAPVKRMSDSFHGARVCVSPTLSTVDGRSKILRGDQ
jgi:hypothetical protein